MVSYLDPWLQILIAVQLKSPDLFVFMVGQLQLQYMAQSRSQSSRKKGSNREDELGHSIHTIDGHKGTETDKLLREVLDNATSLLFELICAVNQANCFSVEDNILNMFWRMKIVQAQEQARYCVQRIMKRLTLLVSSSGRYVSPTEAVLLYRQLYLLKSFLEYGTVVANQIRVGYAEEFRYYIRKQVVKKKLSTKFLLTSPITELLEKVTDLVLKQPSLGDDGNISRSLYQI
ncbi:Uncharacterized protein C12orf56-like [Stylophora pistillata]|uniref:Uncharacterized protein C12orf56-like n=1 Tax=Stylophora pistillata TaxID=50429 RepID=A0A2B4R869_STYPI|nr:Uncharacterized protein C12orf56-like [Stylophora pistillata]